MPDYSIQEGLANLGQFMVSPQMPVLAGQLGAAAMGPDQRSWQANGGRVASGFGQSAIAAKEAQAQQAKTPAMNQWLAQILPALMAGVKHTPTGVDGPSSTKVEVKNDGTGTMTTNFDVGTKGGNAPAGAPAQSQPPQATQPAPQQQFNPRLLPF